MGGDAWLALYAPVGLLPRPVALPACASLI